MDGDTNVPFQATGDLKLDVYRATSEAHDNPGAHPVIVYFYGGGWRSGSKEKYRFVASRLAAEGFVVVTPGYRLYPEVTFPAFVHDAAEALRWVFDNIKQFGGEPDKVFVMGHSAGAHIAAMLHYDERYLQDAGASQTPCGFIGLAGPYKFLPLKTDIMRSIFPADVREASQPVNFVDGTEGPALLIHGTKDTRVYPRNSENLHRIVTEAGGEAQLIVYEGRSHGGVLVPFSRLFGFLEPVVDDVSEFVARQDCRLPN